VTGVVAGGEAEGRLSPEVGAKLGAAFNVADRWLARTTSPSVFPAPGSSIAGDDAALQPWNISHTVLTALAGAVDHFHAAKTLLADAEVLHTYAQFSLLRPALENAATAVFLLAPPARNLRVLRALRLEWADVCERNKVIEELGQQPNTPPDVRKTELQNKARARGLSVDEVAQVAARPDSYSKIVRTAGDEALGGIGAVLLVIWMLNSGSTHGKKWATWSMIDRAKLIPSGVAGVMEGPVTAPENQVLFSAVAARMMISKAWELYDLRRLAPGR